MGLLAGGGGGSGGYKGVTPNNVPPGGLVVAGTIQAGNVAKEAIPDFQVFYGSTQALDEPGNNADSDPVLLVFQSQALQLGDLAQSAFIVQRVGDISLADYIGAAVHIEDLTSSAAPALRVKKGGSDQLLVDGDGVQIHGKLKTGASVTHTLGAYSGKAVPVYNESGTLLGYAPLYA